MSNMSKRRFVLYLTAILVSLNPSFASTDCKVRDFGQNDIVCVCTSKYCDTVPKPGKIQTPKFFLYTSNQDGLRFNKTELKFKPKRMSDKTNQILIDSTQKYQKILGFGGAFTDSTGINIKDLDPNAQNFLLKSYFSSDGIEYNMGRVPIGSTDFSTHYYTYDDSENEDPELEKFNLAEEDYEFKIPYIKKALELNKNLKLFGSPWTAPKWMKTNNAYTGYGFLKNEFYDSWAKYFVKFLEMYQKNGVNFWGITTQNEPSMAFLQLKNIPTVGWTSTQMSTWVRENLGPALKNSSFRDIQIMVLDDQKALLPWAVNSILANEETRSLVSGIAIHWYTNVITPCSVVEKTHDNFKEKFILSTEAANGFQSKTKVSLGSWERGESYSTDIIEDMNCWVSGWVDWNMVLNMDGGPVAIDNRVDAPIIVNKKSGEFYKQPAFYHLGHFSKFVSADSVRIGIEMDLMKRFMVTAFQRPDNGIVVVILNKNDEDVNVTLIDKIIGEASITITKRSINTILYW